MASSRVLRELLVRLGVQLAPNTIKSIDTFTARIDAAKRRLFEVADAAFVAGRSLAAMALGGAAALVKFAVGAGQSATSIVQQADALNLTREEYQKMLHVFDRFGAKSDDMADAFVQLAEKSVDAQAGGKESAEAFALLGIRVDELRGKNPAEIFKLMADRAKGAADRQKVMAASSRLLGEDLSRKLLPALRKGKEGIEAMEAEAVKLGLVLRDEQIVALGRVSTEWARFKGVLVGVANDVLSRFAPQIEGVLTLLTDFTAAWGRVAVGLTLALSPVLLLLAGLALGLSAPVLIIGGLVTAVGLLALAFEDLWVWMQGGNSLIDQNLDLIERWIPAFGGLRDLVWALAQNFGVMLDNIWLLAQGVLTGLLPAFEQLDAVLSPVLDKLDRLWDRANTWAGNKLRDMAARVDQLTVQDAAWGEQQAVAMQRQVSEGMAGALTRQIANTVDNSRASTTTNNSQSVVQNNNFVTDVGTAVHDGINRLTNIARTGVLGGRR